MHEESYIAGQRTVGLALLRLALESLGYEGTEVEHSKWILEREAAVSALHDACAEYGDNDWDNTLHLGDVIEKHLYRHLAGRDDH